MLVCYYIPSWEKHLDIHKVPFHNNYVTFSMSLGSIVRLIPVPSFVREGLCPFWLSQKNPQVIWWLYWLFEYKIVSGLFVASFFVLLTDWFFMLFFWIILFGEKLVDTSFKPFLCRFEEIHDASFCPEFWYTFSVSFFFFFNSFLFQGIFALLPVANYIFLLPVF